MNIIILVDETKPEINGQPKYFCIPSSAYPHNREPQQGDTIGLRIVECQAKGVDSKEYSVFVHGLYEVLLVTEGLTHLNVPELALHRLTESLPNADTCFRVTIQKVTNVEDELFVNQRYTPIDTCVYF